MGHTFFKHIQMKIQNTKNLMIVAHCDDEAIWAGEMLLKEKKMWDIFCVVTPDSQSTFRIPMFLDKVSNYLECNTELLPFPDLGFGTQIVGDIYTPIEKKILSKNWDKIYTHGFEGEYGHSHHQQINKTVIEIINKNNLQDKLWLFKPFKKQEVLILSEEKLKFFENTYDDESNLPYNHPRKWIHGWNTKMGWVEGFEKYIKS